MGLSILPKRGNVMPKKDSQLSGVQVLIHHLIGNSTPNFALSCLEYLSISILIGAGKFTLIKFKNRNTEMHAHTHSIYTGLGILWGFSLPCTIAIMFSLLLVLCLKFHMYIFFFISQKSNMNSGKKLQWWSFYFCKNQLYF